MSSPHRFDRPEDFLYPGTNVLRNRLNITDAEELERAEGALTFGRLVELRSTGAGAGDFAHLQAIHRHMLQDIYEWAGQVRAVTLGKGTTQFCLPQHLESLAATHETMFGSRARADQFAAEFQYLGRMAEASEISEGIVFILSDRAAPRTHRGPIARWRLLTLLDRQRGTGGSAL